MFLTAAVVLIAVLTVAGASAVARAERCVVAIKLTILLLVVVGGVFSVSSTRDARSLGRATCRWLFVIVLYVLGAVVAVGSVPVCALIRATHEALAVAARPTYAIAKARELPAQLERPICNQPLEGLIITAGESPVTGSAPSLAIAVHSSLRHRLVRRCAHRLESPRLGWIRHWLSIPSSPGSRRPTVTVPERTRSLCARGSALDRAAAPGAAAGGSACATVA